MGESGGLAMPASPVHKYGQIHSMHATGRNKFLMLGRKSLKFYNNFMEIPPKILKRFTKCETRW